MCADRLDHAWAAMEALGIKPEDDTEPELEEEYEDDEEHGVCTVCNGDAFKIGGLGLLEFYKCRQCGSITTPFADEGEEMTVL
jgi:hypothetical protein